MLYNDACKNNQFFKEQLEVAIIVPIYKDGSETSVRPISLLAYFLNIRKSDAYQNYEFSWSKPVLFGYSIRSYEHVLLKAKNILSESLSRRPVSPIDRL